MSEINGSNRSNRNSQAARSDRDENKQDKRYRGPLWSLNNQAGNGMPNEGRDHSVDGLDEEELELRRLMHGAVQDLRPSEEALDRLFKAIPARRALRRQVVVGAAAAALLVGTAIPAFIHVAGAGGGVPDPAVAVGHSDHDKYSTGAADGDSSGRWEKDMPQGGNNATGKDSRPHKPSGTGKDTQAGTTGGGGRHPSDTSAKGLPVCGAQQLGVTSASIGQANADGDVYGTFRVSNISGTHCMISDAGTMNIQARGAADPARITVVDHTAGDAAAGLPDPSQETTGLVLAPSQSYEVKFAWVPTGTCPTTEPSPEPSASDDSAGTGGDVATQSPGNTSPQLAYTDGADTSDGSVAVVHEAEPGVPTAEATIPGACAGTIYRTGVLATP
jgi:hypothetical protein